MNPSGTSGTSSGTGQQHPISLYLKIWGLLFVLSTNSNPHTVKYRPMGCC